MSDNPTPSSQVKISWIFWTLLAFTIFVVIAAYSSRMTNDYTDYDQTRATERIATLKKLQDADRATLGTADWIDQNKGIVRIPIDEAILREIATLKTKPLEPGASIVPVAPPATTNAAPASATNSAPAGATNAAPATTNTAPATPPSPTKETK